MKSTKQPKFLLVQYAPGSAGKFLISLLMGSKEVAHFDSIIDQDKTVQNCALYIKEHFTPHTGDWLKHEPRNIEAWNLHFISTKHNRGHDMSYDQFISIARQEASPYFWEQVENEKVIITPWHKTYVPEFYKNAKIVTILLDADAEKWFHRAVWSKLYGIKNGRIHLKMNDPDFNPPMQQYFTKFNNPIYSDDHFFSFVKKNILKDQFKKQYTDSKNFTVDKNRTFINLSELLSAELCASGIARICQELDIGSVPTDLVDIGRAHWAACHNFKYNNI